MAVKVGKGKGKKGKKKGRKKKGKRSKSPAKLKKIAGELSTDQLLQYKIIQTILMHIHVLDGRYEIGGHGCIADVSTGTGMRSWMWSTGICIGFRQRFFDSWYEP